MAIQTRKMTAAEFLALPESNQHHELIQGEEMMSPSPTVNHQRILFRLSKLLSQKIPSGEIFIAPIDVYLDDENVVQPDVLWVSSDSKCKEFEGKLRGAPDLIIEIFSPGTARRDKKDKFKLYEKHGVREYWMVDPDEKYLEIWKLEENRYVQVGVFGPDDPCTSSLLGEITLKEIFPA